MVGKSLHYYYIITLWVVAFVSVFLIIKPMITSHNEGNIFSDISENPGQGDIDQKGNPKQVITKEGAAAVSKNDSNDLIFYDKTAFIRYFSNKFSTEELSDTYNAVVGINGDLKARGSIQVVRKGNVVKSPKTFSGSFDIRPLPGNGK